MAPEKARVAVVGAGWWSTSTHIPALQANPRAELVAVCDHSDAALKKAVDAFGLSRTYKDFREMLAAGELDGVIVAVNHSAHYEVAKACLEAGLHVMLEKPMVLRAAHARELVSLADQRGRALIIGYPWHYTDITRRARDVLASGELGAIQYIECLFASMAVEFYRGNDQAYRSTFQYPVTGPGRAYADLHLSGGGQGHLQVTHAAGSLFYVTGLQPDRVSCYMENWDVAVDLVDAISLRFRPINGHGAVGVIGSTGNIGIGDGGQLVIRVYCERGYLILEQVQSTLVVRHHDGREDHYGPLPAGDRYPRFATANNLVDVILGRATNGSPASVGARVVEMLEAAYRSGAEGGRPVSIAELY